MSPAKSNQLISFLEKTSIISASLHFDMLKKWRKDEFYEIDHFRSISFIYRKKVRFEIISAV